MRGRHAVIALCLLAIAMAPNPVAAKNMHGKFGVGFQRTLLGVQGFSFTYWMTPKLAFLTTAGLGFNRANINRARTITADDGTESTEVVPSESWRTRLLAAMGVKYVLYGTKYANLSFGALADLGWANRLIYDTEVLVDADGNSQTIQATASNRIQWGIEFPMEIEFFFSDAFAINLAAGMFFTVVPAAPANFTGSSSNSAILESTGLGAVNSPEGVGIAIGAGGLFGHAGMTFYF
jgi:hypothetical protein